MKRALMIVVASAVMIAAGLPARATPEISIDTASRDGTTGHVEGHAVFPPIDEQFVGGSGVDFDPPEAGQVAGVDLVDASITPLPDRSGLRFTWYVSQMLPDVPAEVVRYTWSLRIGERTYQLQAKRTNLLSLTTVEDPVNHALQLGQLKYFQLRGACETSYRGTPSDGCYHLAFVDGAFDPANNRVWIDWPYETTDTLGRIVAPDFKPGVLLEEFANAGMSITASFQAVLSSTTTSDYINGWENYYDGARIDLGVNTPTRPSQAVDYMFPATLHEDGTFAGDVSGMSEALNTIFVRACHGKECAYHTVTL